MHSEENNDSFGILSYHAYPPLIKAALFKSSSLSLLKKNEIAPACILGYYALFHFGISVMFSNAEKTSKHHGFLIELRDKAKQGHDPQLHNKLKHRILREILNDMRFVDLSNALYSGMNLRTMYNYGLRLTIKFHQNSVTGTPFFGNPVNPSSNKKFSPKDCTDFLSTIDDVIRSEFLKNIKWLSSTSLEILASTLQNNANNFLDDKKFHLSELFCEETINLARNFLSDLINQLDIEYQLYFNESD
jgi:hypothetical protein